MIPIANKKELQILKALDQTQKMSLTINIHSYEDLAKNYMYKHLDIVQ